MTAKATCWSELSKLVAYHILCNINRDKFVVVNELHHFDDSFQVILHIGHFHIADGSAGGQPLELRLKAQLGKGIDGLGNMVTLSGNFPVLKPGDNIIQRTGGSSVTVYVTPRWWEL